MLLGPYEALMAKNYVDNLSEEVKKGLSPEKAETGTLAVAGTCRLKHGVRRNG
jgi:hypothetical protein